MEVLTLHLHSSSSLTFGSQASIETEIIVSYGPVGRSEKAQPAFAIMLLAHHRGWHIRITHDHAWCAGGVAVDVAVAAAG